MRGLAGSYDIGLNGSMPAFATARAGAGNVINSHNRSYTITNAGIDATELERIERRKEMLYGG